MVSFTKCLVLLASLAASVYSRPLKRASFSLDNGLKAQAMNKQFLSLTPDSPCTPGQIACIHDEFAQCVNGKFELSECGAGLICLTLPLVLSPGTSVTCDTEDDAKTRFANTGVKGGITGDDSTDTVVAAKTKSTSAQSTQNQCGMS